MSEVETVPRPDGGARVRPCDLPGCEQPIEQVDGQPVRKYCTPAHRLAARRARAERSRRSPVTGPRDDPAAVSSGARPDAALDVPATVVPDIHAPDIHAPDIHAPDIHTPDISHDRLLRGVPRPDGWRRLRSSPSRTRSTDADRRAELFDRARVPLRGARRVAVVSLPGGVGRTTVTAAVGTILADLRGDRVAVVDADPEAGTLADRLHVVPGRTVKDLAAGADRVVTVEDADRYVGRAGRLDVLAGERDATVVSGLSGAEVTAAAEAMARFHDLVLVDTGAGLMNESSQAALADADAVVVVGASDPESTARAGRALDWLDAHGHAGLATDAVVVLCCTRDVATCAPDELVARCRAVHVVPFDPALSTGGRIVLERLRAGTRSGFLETAASLGDVLGAGAERADGAPSVRRPS